MRASTRTVFGLAALAGVAGCYSPPVVLAPVAAPAAEWPRSLDELTEPSEPGLTRITLDANGTTARVDEVLDTTNAVGSGWGVHESVFVNTSSMSSKPICMTPCQADFKPGLHVLHFSDRSGSNEYTAEVQVGSHPKAVRIAFGHRTAGKTSSGAGVALFAVGLCTSLVGSVLWASSNRNKEYGAALETPGMGLTLGGAGLMALSVPFLVSTPDKIQPGAKTELAAPAR